MGFALTSASLQIRKQKTDRKGSSRQTLTHVFDVLSRSDSPVRLLIESWGGYNKGYTKSFHSDAELSAYLERRLVKIRGDGPAFDATGRSTAGSSAELSYQSNRVHSATADAISADWFDSINMNDVVSSCRTRIRNILGDRLRIENQWSSRRRFATSIEGSEIPAAKLDIAAISALIYSRVFDSIAASKPGSFRSDFGDSIEAVDQFISAGGDMEGFPEFETANLLTTIKKSNESAEAISSPDINDVLAEEDLPILKRKPEVAYESWGAWS